MVLEWTTWGLKGCDQNSESKLKSTWKPEQLLQKSVQYIPSSLLQLVA